MTSSHRLSYITGLDGIRAVAVMAVLCYHANYPWALGGFLGVETFFVLSGFLITSLLLVEWRNSGRIDLQNFWLRRARRLLPAVWLLLLVLPFLAILFARDALPRLKEDIPAALIYITNWVYIVREIPYFEAFGRPPLLQQLWSLAVEEQFYLLWPIILLVLLRTVKKYRSGLLVATFFLIALSSVWMALSYSPADDPLRVYYGTDTRASGFLVGAFLAVVWPPRKAVPESGGGMLEIIGWTGLVGLLLLYNLLNEFQLFLYRGGILLAALMTALLIIGASSPSTSLSKLFEHRILRWIGTRSYSIYLWHWPVFMLTRPGIDVPLPALPVRLGQLAITFALAELSYRWVEYPIRHQGFRSSLRSWQVAFRQWSTPKKLSLGAGIVSASMLLIWQGSIQVPENISVIQDTSAPISAVPINAVDMTPTISASESTEEANVVAPPTPSTKMAPQEIKPTSTRTADLPRVTLIGDSIMQGARPMIEDVLGEGVYIDAARKRKMEDVPALVETLEEEGHLAPVVLIHLGSNRPFEAPVFDQVMVSLIAHQVERIIFVNVHRPIGWEFYVNKQFTEGLARWPQAELIDWEAMAHSEQGWFIKDQTHLSYDGSEAYVGAIKEKLNTIP